LILGREETERLQWEVRGGKIGGWGGELVLLNLTDFDIRIISIRTYVINKNIHNLSF